MSVSETPKSRLDTISFPGPAVVKAAGLKQSLWKSQHWQAMFQANTCPALPQVDPGTDRAAIGSSCSSQQTCKNNTIYNQIQKTFSCETFFGLGGHMYLLVIMTETSLWLHTLHILTVSNHPTVKRLKKVKEVNLLLLRTAPPLPPLPAPAPLPRGAAAGPRDRDLLLWPACKNTFQLSNLWPHCCIEAAILSTLYQFRWKWFYKLEKVMTTEEKNVFLTWADGPLLLLLALPPPLSWLRPREADLPRTWPLNNVCNIQ